MSIDASQGPIVTYRAGAGASTNPANQNPQAGPSSFVHGIVNQDLRDPYCYVPGNANSVPVYGWLGSGVVVDQVPSAIADNNIAASQSPGGGVRTLTLVSATGAGITVGVSIYSASTGSQVTGLLAIDGAMAGQGYGQDLTINVWDPTKAIARNVRITSGGDDSGITFTVNGYDIYNYPMSETITGASTGIAAGKKAFKYISSITLSGNAAGTVKVGTGDVYGFPLRVDRLPYAYINWNNALITSGTFVAADTTSPATATTGDVRGTIVSASASDGTRRMFMSIAIPAANLSTSTGWTGVTQA